MFNRHYYTEDFLTMDINHIHEIIQSYRHDLPANGRTAAAIDHSAPLAEISECAEEEGLHALASVLFRVQQEELNAAGELDTLVQANEAIQQFRRHLPATSKTAAAIDRGACWDEVSLCAEQEGLRQSQLATVLFEAQQERLRRQL
jgi:hypothetical protein